MFQSPKKRLQALLDVVDDMLVGAPEPEPVPHPHDRCVQLRIARRAGAVAPRSMHCLCPVRPVAAATPAERAAGRGPEPRSAHAG